ncbi:MAG: flippase [Bacteroidetes bacterium]|nr:flippase [Bacteroidota bacterium]
MILARYYGPETFGQFTFAHTLAMTFLLFADFGFDILLTTEIAKSKKNAALIFQQIFSLKLIFTIISLVGMFLFTLVFDISNEARELAIVFSFFMVFTTLTNFLFALFKGFEKLNLESIISFTINIGLIIFTVAAIYFRINVIFVAVGFTISRMIGFILGIKFSMNLVPNIKFSLLFNDLKNIRGKVLVFGFHFLFSFLFFQLDTLLLALLKGDYYVGIYQSVFKLIMLPLVLPEIFINVLLPLLSRLNIENHKQWKKTGSIMSKILFIIIIPVSLILFIYAEEIIDIIYGLQNYHEAVNILKIFSLIVFVRFCLEPFALMLTTSNRQIVRMYVVITAAIVNLVLNIIFIPYYGLLGAAFVSLACNLFVGILYIIVNIKLFKEWFVNSKSVIILISSLILYYFIEDLLHINLWNGLFIIVAIYSCLAYFYFFSKEEKSLLLSYNFTSRKT